MHQCIYRYMCIVSGPVSVVLYWSRIVHGNVFVLNMDQFTLAFYW